MLRAACRRLSQSYWASHSASIRFSRLRELFICCNCTNRAQVLRVVVSANFLQKKEIMKMSIDLLYIFALMEFLWGLSISCYYLLVRCKLLIKKCYYSTFDHLWPKGMSQSETNESKTASHWHPQWGRIGRGACSKEFSECIRSRAPIWLIS